MIDYIKFWAAKEIVALLPFIVIFGGISLFILVLYGWDKCRRIWKKMRGR